MGLESATTISQLDANNPPSTDKKKQGDDHLRMIKAVLKFCFPNASKAFYFPDTVVKNGNYAVLASDMNKTILCDTTSAFTLTMPTLVAGDAGWTCFVLKTTTDVNPVWIAPPSSTISGFTKVRRSVENVLTRVLWTGSAWIASRSPGCPPVGSVIEFYGTTLPNGHLWPDGATFLAVDYVELNTVYGGNTKPDRKGRTAFCRDDIGAGGAAGRLTTALGGVDGITLKATGGLQNHTNTVAEMVAHDHGGVTGNPTTNPTIAAAQAVADAGSPPTNRSQAQNTTPSLPNHVHSIPSQGSTTPYPIVNPAIVANFIIVAE